MNSLDKSDVANVSTLATVPQAAWTGISTSDTTTREVLVPVVVTLGLKGHFFCSPQSDNLR